MTQETKHPFTYCEDPFNNTLSESDGGAIYQIVSPRNYHAYEEEPNAENAEQLINDIDRAIHALKQLKQEVKHYSL